MKRAMAACAAALAMIGCSKDKPRPRVAEAKVAAGPPQAVADSGDIVLDEAAQKQGGVLVERVRVRSVPQALRANGKLGLNENQTWRVGAVTEGRIVKVLANAGDQVEEGQILARMHSHMIHEARADYRRAVAELARLKAAEEYAMRARDRARRLLEIKAGSLAETERADSEYRNAQTAARNGEIEVDRTRRHLVEFLQIPPDVPDHNPDAPHDDDQDLIPIKAPASGTLLTRNVTPGTVVQPSMDLFVISDLSSLWMIAELNEEYLPRVKPGMPVRVYVMAYPDAPFTGKIGRLGAELDPTTRTVRVRVDLPNRGARLKPEMYGTAEIELGGSEPALFVPQEALQELRGETVVFARKVADRFEARPVELGRTVEGLREVTRGLDSGAAVVTAGSFTLKSQAMKATLGQE
jgi:cobalt-zinc-cadmium efflux system membrane fusion protein